MSGRAGSPSDAVSMTVPDSGGDAGAPVTAARSWAAVRAGSRGAAAAPGVADPASRPPAATTIAAGTVHRARRGR